MRVLYSEGEGGYTDMTHLMSDPDTLLSLLGPVLGEVCLVLDFGPGLGRGGGVGLTEGET